MQPVPPTSEKQQDVVATLEAQNAQLRTDKDFAQGTCKYFQDLSGQKGEENGKLRDENGKLRDENAALKEEVGKLKEELYLSKQAAETRKAAADLRTEYIENHTNPVDRGTQRNMDGIEEEEEEEEDADMGSVPVVVAGGDDASNRAAFDDMDEASLAPSLAGVQVGGDNMEWLRVLLHTRATGLPTPAEIRVFLKVKTMADICNTSNTTRRKMIKSLWDANIGLSEHTAPRSKCKIQNLKTLVRLCFGPAAIRDISDGYLV